MKVSKQISIGLRSYFKAGNIIFNKGIIIYFIFPLLINIAFLWGGLEIASNLTEKAQSAFMNWVSFGDSDFFMAEYLDGFFSGVIWVFIKILFFLIFAYLGGYLILIILSPVFSIISEKTEYKITNTKNDAPFNMSQFIKDILRGLVLTIRNMLIEFALLIPIFIIGFIPIIGWLGALFLFFASSYFYGFSYMDYTNERRKRTVKESVAYIWKYKWIAISNGSVFALSLLIPFCGVLLAAFIAILSIIAATIAMLEIEEFNKLKNV